MNTSTQRSLGDLEQSVLIAVLNRQGNAYGITVQTELEKITGRKLSSGAVYTVLSRLEEKDFLASELGDPTPERGGRRKRLYRVTKNGTNALEATRKHFTNLWAGNTKR